VAVSAAKVSSIIFVGLSETAPRTVPVKMRDPAQCTVGRTPSPTQSGGVRPDGSRLSGLGKSRIAGGSPRVNQKQTHSEALADKVPHSRQAQRLGVHMPASAQLSAHVSPSFMIKFDLEPKPDATFRRRHGESILDDSFWSHNPWHNLDLHKRLSGRPSMGTTEYAQSRPTEAPYGLAAFAGCLFT
jgi:hypothetical protein